MEFWDVFDRAGAPMGVRVPKGHAFADGEYHAAVEVWLFDGDNRVLVQKRSLKKKLLPGLWALTCGRVQSGETPEEACLRELFEEVGVAPLDRPARVRGPVPEDAIHMLWYFFCAQMPPGAQIALDAEEVDAARFVDPAEFQAMLDEGLLFRYAGVEEMARTMFAQKR